MGHIDQIGMTARKPLPAGMALHTRLGRSLFTQKAQRKSVGKRLAPHSRLAAEYIRMRDLSCFHCIFKMLLDLLMSQNVLKNQHLPYPL